MAKKSSGTKNNQTPKPRELLQWLDRQAERAAKAVDGVVRANKQKQD